MSVVQQLQELISDTSEPLSLAQDGLLKSDRLYKTKYHIEDRLREISKELDERSQLSIEKTIPKWRNVPKSDIFVSAEEAVKQFTPLIGLLQELIVKFSTDTKHEEILKEEVVISSGKPYDGRQYLRYIFNEAASIIFIRDSYLRPEILDILIEYLLDKKDLKIKILMGENDRLPPFRANFLVLNSQYPNRIEARYISRDSGDHPRYIFIDNQLLFNPDHSLDQWGRKTVNVHQMIDKIEIEKVKSNLVKEWENAIQI